jgi:pyruvate, water dikinase
MWIRWFDTLGMGDVPLVGGKNASLGELRRALTPLGVRTPDGFATTAEAYAPVPPGGDLEPLIAGELRGLDVERIDALQAAGTRIRAAILAAPLPAPLSEAVVEAYRQLEAQYGPHCDVAVRSSATAEDLPEASFAGQQETYLNIHGDGDAARRRAPLLRLALHRPRHRLPHPSRVRPLQVALSVGVQKMVRADLACAGVMFSIDTETGFQDAVLITGAWGLGESVVQGTVNPDEFYVFKPTLAQGYRPILQRRRCSARRSSS